MKKLARFSFVVGLGLLLFVLLKIDFSEATAVVQRIRLPFLVPVISLVAMEAIVKALKIKVLVSSSRPLTLKHSLAIYFVGLALGSLTPGQVGDLGKAYTLKKKTGLDLTSSFSVLLIERLLELGVLFLLALGGVAVLIFYAGQKMWSWLFLLLLAGVTSSALLLNNDIFSKVSLKLLSSVVPVKYRKPVSDRLSGLFRGINEVLKKRRVLVIAALLLLLWWGLASTHFYLLALSLNLKVHFLNLIPFIPLISIIEILPISWMGFGTREYGTVLLLSQIGVTAEESVILSLLGFVVTMAPQIAIGYLFVVKEHLVGKDRQPDFYPQGSQKET